jgi:hypothetical protein
MTVLARSFLRRRMVILSTCALILAWFVISHSFAAYFAATAPRTALWLNPDEPNALVNLADWTLNRSQNTGVTGAAATEQAPQTRGDTTGAAAQVSPGVAAASQMNNRDFSEFRIVDPSREIDLPTVRAWADASVMNAPLDARALRILGQAATAAGDEAEAASFMQEAARLSLHESLAVYWLLVQSAKEKDNKAAIYYADAILRTLPGFDSYVIPILALIAEDKDSASFLKAVLTDDPPWRSNFLQGLPRSVRDERVPLDFLVGLRNSPRPPTAADINGYLDFLVQHKMYALAYYTWLQFLPDQSLRSAGLLYNGDFNIAPSGSPFDWRITQGSGVNVDIEERPDKRGADALVIDFEYGRVEYHSVKQLIMLAPGQYQFQGQYKGALVGPRGLKWRLACAESPTQPFAESDMIRGGDAAWKDAKFNFTVPAQDCAAQYLSLDLDARMPSEEFMTGSIWFDELKISRAAGAQGE